MIKHNRLITMDGGDDGNLVIKKRFVSEAELDERRKRRQEEWEKVRKPEDPEECPEEVYDPRSLYERLQEQKDRKQQEYEEQFKFKNKKEVEKKLTVKPMETKNKFSQAKLLAGAVKHKSSESGNSVKRLKPDPDPDDKNQVCIGILPGLGAYSGSSDSESSSDSEGTINATGKIVSSIFRTNTFLEAP
ncbi:Protein FAM192A [Tupaia chinensis]|uniref:Protein FAM192A n=1 Tax=Tupaia chinensis TaxID=246437 RepID=L9KTE0_TUPCH|nr:Protein FAM192A [Tupaia chinensis]